MLEPDANKIFTTILRLKEPWYVDDVKATPERVDISISSKSGSKVECPVCGEMCRIHDRIERTWRHTDMGEAECFITAKIPRCDCPKCGVKQVPVPWAREFVGYTEYFERKAISLMKRMPLTRTAEIMHVSADILLNIVRYHVNRELDGLDLSDVSRIFLDETSSKRGHRYITVIADVDTKRIIFMTEGKGIDSLAEFSDWLYSHNGDPHNIRLVSCDFSKSFLSGIDRHLPRAEVVYDRFHLVKMANDALDKIRSKNQMNGFRHKWMRFKLLKNGKDLSSEEREKIFDIKEDNKVLGLAYEMKESLIQLYDYPDISAASEHVREWLGWVEKEGEPRMKAVGRTVSRHFHKILNWYHDRMSNGFLEGLNGMIQTTKRIGRGYPNTQNFITMVFFRHGRLNI